MTDYSKYGGDGLTEEDLAAATEASQTRRFGFKNGGWYKFRVMSQASAVSKPKDKEGNPKPDATGSKLVYEGMHALTANDSLSTKTDEVRHLNVIWAHTEPELLEEEGYNEQQIAFVAKKGVPKTREMMLQRMRAQDPAAFAGKGDAEQSQVLRTMQSDFFTGKLKTAGTELYAQVGYEQSGIYTNVRLKYFRAIDSPPKNPDGTAIEINDPDSGTAVPF